jgi:DNA-binding response OmpR family regulator
VLISRLRRKLEDDPLHPQLIQTVRGEGYYFTREVTWQTHS